MQLDIIHRDGGSTRRRSFPPGEVVLGSRAGCDVALEGPGVAPVHAFAFWQNDHWVLVAAALDAALEVRGRRLKSVVLGPLTQALLGSARVTFIVSTRAPGGPLLDLDPSASSGAIHSTLPVGDLATLIGLATDPGRASARDAEAHTARLLLLVGSVAEGLIGQPDTDALLESIVALVFEHVAVDRALLLLGEGRASELVPSAHRAKAGTPGDGVALSHTIADEALRTRCALRVDAADQDARFARADSVAELGIRSALCAPLLVAGRTTGLLYADRATGVFTALDLQSFSILAHLAAAAMQRQGLQDRLERERRDRERLSRYHAATVVEHVLSVGHDTGMLAEVREVSVLFADLVEFTKFCERLPATSVQALLNTVLEALTEEVFREQGTLDKFIGDQVMVFFNAPLSQPDHALRAVRTGLRMQRRISELRAQVPELGSLALRVGINTGTAVVGEVGARTRRDYTVIGDTVNVASRLETSVARPGEVVVSSGTFVLVAGAVRATSLGEVRLPGRGEPLHAWRVEELTESEGPEPRP
jgi:adenylate cyclase